MSTSSESKSKQNWKNGAWLVLFAAIELFFLAITFLTLANSITYVNKTLTASAVVDSVQAYAWDDRNFYDALVHFTAADGQRVVTHVLQTVNGLVAHDPQAGETLEIRYDPKDPSAATISSFLELWWKPLGLSILVLVFAATLWGFVKKRWDAKSPLKPVR